MQGQGVEGMSMGDRPSSPAVRKRGGPVRCWERMGRVGVGLLDDGTAEKVILGSFFCTVSR
ncbi:protein of unknown function [Ectopseudomonas oleovorans]|nr:protein of unknown function [Pseudomonas oleovorans]